MAGNVSEWVQDVYRPLSSMDYDDMPAPFREISMSDYTGIHRLVKLNLMILLVA
jgi:formylglycine-generating enzyme required for sulfatase activity